MIYKFTKSGEKVIEISNEIAIRLGHTYIGTEHLLYGLAKEKNGIASKVLEKQNIDYKNILEKIEEIIGKNNFIKAYNIGFTPRLKKVIENAYEEAKKIRSDFIGTEHLLIGIIKENDSIAGRILIDLGIDITKIYKELVKILNEIEKEDYINFSEETHKTSENLKQFGIDLTKKARDGKLDPVIGRDVETERLIEILLRRMKNNPCLIGEPGVGKTAVVEGLAQRIVNNNVPEILKNKQVITLDISSMVAGAKYRGDFEERIKKVLNEVKKSKQIILFIDEIHTIVGAGAAEGAIDAANILKPLLARGDIQVIGATTLNEYRKYIEKDSALERRFQQVIVNEPSKEDTIKILKGLADKYEAHHNVKITEEAIEAATDLSIRYISDRFLPDKAIDLIDESCAKAKLEVFTEPKQIKEMTDKLSEIENEKNSAINIQDFEVAAALRDEYMKLNSTLEEAKNNWKNENLNKIISITKEDICNVLSRMTGIPVNKINEDENKKLINLEEKIHENVIGQEEAVKSISKAIRRSRVGLKDPGRPIGSFLFLGPTGVGKTELAKTVAKVMFDSEDSIIRLDMSEYMESHSVSKLIGSPPGYIGYDENHGLTEKVRRKPYTVVLFDEIEKAHPDIMNLCLQILEDGRLTDSQGRIVDFKNTIIIMTSNVGAKLISEKKQLGFNSNNQDEYLDIKKEVTKQLKKEFKPEFLNRIDETIIFHKLSEEETQKIFDVLFNKLKKRLESQKIDIAITDEAKKYVIRKEKISEYGARPLKRAIQNNIEDLITDEILSGKIKENMKILIDIENENLIIKNL